MGFENLDFLKEDSPDSFSKMSPEELRTNIALQRQRIRSGIVTGAEALALDKDIEKMEDLLNALLKSESST